MKIFAITGASSFIGQHLIRTLRSRGDVETRLLIHRSRPKELTERKGIKLIKGNLLRQDSSRALFENDCTVINLAYLNGLPIRENLTAMKNLVENCIEARIKRLIHCSTAVVVGGTRDDIVTEETRCEPISEYETTKLQIEELLKKKARDHFELAILRPTVVFGPGGKNLLKLAGDLTAGRVSLNYLKSCLYGSRKMNLVYVDTVVAALLFLAFTAQEMNGDTFIISDDEYPTNNYRDIETYLIREFGCVDYPVPRIPLPPFLLSRMLRLAGRSNFNPNRVYRSEKIRSLGFRKTTPFETGLLSFAEWYRQEYLSAKEKNEDTECQYLP
jgi:nucleoside-diphosphate-sugar epimerase